MQNSDGIIVILSYPDTVVRPAYWEFSSKIWPLIGIGGKHAVKAGHAALLLMKKGKPEINYFDFGRYITSYGNGRVRSKETDPELSIPLKASFKDDKLLNLKEILIWLDKHPEKTHGDGKLIATTNNEIEHVKAKKYIDTLINKKEIPYGVLVKEGTNCARFVTDTIIASTSNKKIKSNLKKSNLLTPSPLGNVIKGSTSNIIYQVENQDIKEYTNRSILKEYKAFFIYRPKNKPNLIGTELPDIKSFNLQNATWLGGIGSGAWFKIEEKKTQQIYKIARYNSKGKKDFEGLFKIENSGLDINNEYQFIYPTNCIQPYVLQNDLIYSFFRLEPTT